MKANERFQSGLGRLPWAEKGMALAALVTVAILPNSAMGAMYLPPPTPGGVDPHPHITGLTKSGTNATLHWHGPAGSYQVLMSTTLGTSSWSSITTVDAAANASSVNLSNLPVEQAFFRLLAPPNSYVGDGGCAGCHFDKYLEWNGTDHASAYDAIARVPLPAREGCLPCHTVGAGRPTGFVDLASTPHLTNVSCENCHGPGAAHKYGDHAIVHPIVTLAGEVCGGCHTGPNSPTYEEWKASGHANLEVPSEMTDESTQMRCGPCHSAAVRSAMLANYDLAQSGHSLPLALPSTADATNFGPTCVTCHDPHVKTRPHQVRWPLFSTNFYSFFTSSPTTNIYYTNWAGVVTTNTYWANAGFAAQYQPDLQICAHCHNARGATWQSSGRPPHHSPQYNVLIGAVQTNYLNGINLTRLGTHGRNTNGCVQCHMNRVSVAEPTPLAPNNTGHRFEVGFDGCAGAGCHSSPTQAEIAIIGTRFDATNRIQTVVGLLNQWALNHSPLTLRTNYGALAWEYTTPGGLSNAGTNAGPSNARQALVPDTIKQARFNLYLVFHDGSLGVHNGDYARLLLDLAKSNVNYQITH